MSTPLTLTLILGAATFAMAASLSTPTPAGALDLRLPTDNRHLFDGHPELFYMYVDRTFEGESSQPWQAGSYGYVRNPRRTNSGLIYTRFHEGIDISPMKRDASGNPLDIVKSVGAGTVVHTNPVSGRSNYGKYVVIEHNFAGGPFYSLYAHLATVTCKPGDKIAAGSAIGRLGYTGVGLNRRRAHLHLEFTLLLSSRFDAWHATYAGGSNHHGIYNGMNLAGMDAARLFQLHQKNPAITIPELVRSTPIHFSVTIPRRGTPEIGRRYPWLFRGDCKQSSPSWEISFSCTGLPVAIMTSQRKVDRPVVSRLRRSDVSHSLKTRGLISGTGSTATVASRGEKLIALITGEFPDRRTSRR